MKVAFHTILILLGLWTNVLGSFVTTCSKEGTCLPTAVADCDSCHLAEHHSDEPLSLEGDSDLEESESDDHHHCSHGHISVLAFSPFPANKLLFVAPSDKATLATLPAPPEDPVFSLEQPPQG